MGGTPVFAGTRVPVESLMQHLDAGDALDDFVEGFPSVRREQAIAFIERNQPSSAGDLQLSDTSIS
jgi:uncharacterized protein (DUF433 family)